jgi:hypothetical protein
MTRDRRSSNSVFSLAQDVTQNIVFQSLCFRTASNTKPGGRALHGYHYRRLWVRLHEKGGKAHTLPCHHELEHYLQAYIDAAGMADEKGTPLFRSAVGKTGQLTKKTHASY